MQTDFERFMMFRSKRRSQCFETQGYQPTLATDLASLQDCRRIDRFHERVLDRDDVVVPGHL